uniref:(northern house mosquito) hypothetical protein n=2 Tax=Culex pipiens TaxID=7175 RepID=A0A8D8IRA2_CULPI
MTTSFKVLDQPLHRKDTAAVVYTVRNFHACDVCVACDPRNCHDRSYHAHDAHRDVHRCKLSSSDRTCASSSCACRKRRRSPASGASYQPFLPLRMQRTPRPLQPTHQWFRPRYRTRSTPTVQIPSLAVLPRGPRSGRPEELRHTPLLQPTWTCSLFRRHLRGHSGWRPTPNLGEVFGGHLVLPANLCEAQTENMDTAGETRILVGGTVPELVVHSN